MAPRICSEAAARTWAWCRKAALGAPVVLDVKGHPDCNPFTNSASNPDMVLLHVAEVSKRILGGLPAPQPLSEPDAPSAVPANAPPIRQRADRLPREAPGPEGRRAAEGNPEVIIQQQLGVLKDQTSLLCSLLLLNRSLYPKKEEALPISKLVGFVKTAAGRSAWSFFSEEAWGDGWLPSWNWVRCSFYYGLTVRSSFLQTAIHTYIDSVINQVKDHLANHQDSSERLDALVEKFLTHADTLFRDYLSGTTQFANTAAPTENVDTFRLAAIEARYNNDLPGLCKKFSEKILPLLPPVSFFSTWRSTPYLGKLFARFFDWADLRLNTFLRRKLQESILPGTFEMAVREVKNVSHKKILRLLFKKTLTEVFLGQLRNLQTRFFNPPPKRAETRAIRPPQQLAEVVRKLQDILEMEDYTNEKELKVILARLEKEMQNRAEEDFDTQEKKAIQGGLHTVCRFVLQYIRDPNNTKQILSQILTLCNAPFRQENTSLEDLETQVNKGAEDLEREALGLFSKLVGDTVNDIVLGISPEKEALAEKAFTIQKEGVRNLFHPKLATTLLVPMAEKVRRGEEILPEIASFAKGLETLANRERAFQDHLLQLDPSYAESLKRTLYPLFEKIKDLTDTLEKLKKWQIEYSAQKAMAQSLETMKDQIHLNIEVCTAAEVRQSLAELSLAGDKLKAQYPNGQAEVEDLSHFIHLFHSRIKEVLKQRETLATLALIQEQLAIPQPGNIQSLAETEFTWDRPLGKFFQDSERASFVRQKGEIQAQYTERLRAAIIPLHAQYTELHNQARAEFEETKTDLERFLDQSLVQATEVRGEKYTALEETLTCVSTLCGSLIATSATLEREEILHTTPSALGAIGLASAGTISALATNLYSPTVSLQLAGALVGAGHQTASLVHWWKLGDHPSRSLIKISAVAAVGFVCASYTANYVDPSPTFSFLASLALPAVSGYWGGRKIATTSAKKVEEKVLPKVMKTFKGVLKLSTSSTVSFGILTTIMQAVATSDL